MSCEWRRQSAELLSAETKSQQILLCRISDIDLNSTFDDLTIRCTAKADGIARSVDLMFVGVDVQILRTVFAGERCPLVNIHNSSNGFPEACDARSRSVSGKHR